MVRTCGTDPVCLVYLVCFVYLVDLVHLVYLVGLVQPNTPDRPNRQDRRDRPNEQDRLADFSSALLKEIYEVSRINERPGSTRSNLDLASLRLDRATSSLYDLRVTGQTVGSKENPSANGWRSNGNRKPA